VDAATGVPLAQECRDDYDDAYRELFLRGTLPEAGCPDHGDSLLARLLRWLPGHDDDRRDYEPWPEDLSGRSDEPPPPEYEEAEAWRRHEHERRAQEWSRRMEEVRGEWEEQHRRAQKDAERQRKQWEKEERKRRKEEERRRREQEG
jgi:hypothetical protein